jgi:hypothetical protein
MSRAYKGLEVTIYGKVSERSAGVENVAYIREKLKTMKMADLVRYLVGVGRRYETGELFGAEVKRILAELQATNSQVAQPQPTKVAPGLVVTSKREESESQSTAVDANLISDLLESIQGLE